MALTVEKFKNLIERYGNDEKKLLTENPELDNLYAFSNQREGIIEWFPFEQKSNVLLIGAGEGALIDIWLRKKCNIVIFEKDPQEIEKVHLKYMSGKRNEQPRIEFLDSVVKMTSNEQFDYIVAIDSLHLLEDTELIKIYSMLKNGGQFIASCDNRYGIRYLAGAKPSACFYSRDELERRLSLVTGQVMGVFSEIDKNEKWYYPMPDHRIPSAIYSDTWLPKGGEINRVIPAYNDSEYMMLDIGLKYEEIIHDGRFADFANSYLVVKTKGDAKLNPGIEYVKYNRMRVDKYRIRTTIGRNQHGVLKVTKSALNPEGKEHIESFEEKCRILNRELRSIAYLYPEISLDGMSATWDYIEGEVYSDYIIRHTQRGDDIYEQLKDAIERIITGDKPVHNIDSILGNYLVDGDKLYGIDYEWVSKDRQDPGFLSWRLLTNFYEQHRSLFPEDQKAFLKVFGINEEDGKKYTLMEQELQKSIHADNQQVYLDNYRVYVKTTEQLEADAKDFRMVDGLKLQLKNKNVEIKRMTEEKRLTDNHVHNLEAIIAALRHENSEMGAMLTYLNGHESVFFKARRKAGEKFNAKYPKGSDARKKFDYKKMSLLHPVEYAKLKNTEEGRNLVEGDYKIGSVYRQFGKVKFDTYDKAYGDGPDAIVPIVSIIIPCYNQVDYTYRCLLSIKKYTEDVNYEVIIADDVSTDATKELEKFVEGATIIHAEKNQGFLRNCNDAARKARGKYVMFLNNDTEVTEGWLSSIVNLIEKDDTIGMTGSKLVFPDGKLQEAGGIIWKDGSGWNYGRGQDPDSFEYNYVKDVDYISGAAILIRHDLWKQIGGFDDRYAPAYCEDADLAFEVRKAGYRVVYQPLSKVIHYEGLSNGTDVNGDGLKKYQLENFVKLKEKWADEFEKQYENDGRPNAFRARERSRDKKIVLVVDHYVPTYDKDTGSKCTWQYIQMFINKGFEVKFLGDNYEHEEPYTTELEQMGVEVLYGEQMKADIWKWIDDHAGDIHAAYMNRPHITAKYIDYFKEKGIKCLFFGHDLHFLRIEREAKITGDIGKREESEYWRSVELGIMYKTDMNYYPSYVEENVIHEIDPEIKVKAINLYVFDEFPEVKEKDFAKREGIIFVGGFAHPPNKDGLLWFVNEIWPKVREATGANFYVVGSRADDEVKAVHDPDKGIIFKGFVSDEELKELYEHCRVAAVPLRYGAGVKGKVIESMYWGVPLVTTTIGAEGIQDAESVMKIKDSSDEWIKELSELYNDTDKCRQMSDKATEYVREHNSIEAAWKIVGEDFK